MMSSRARMRQIKTVLGGSNVPPVQQQNAALLLVCLLLRSVFMLLHLLFLFIMMWSKSSIGMLLICLKWPVERLYWLFEESKHDSCRTLSYVRWYVDRKSINDIVLSEHDVNRKCQEWQSLNLKTSEVVGPLNSLKVSRRPLSCTK